MPNKDKYPTPFQDVNTILEELLNSIKIIFGDHLVGMYLEGSLANGGFDQDSDIDFVVVTDEEVSESLYTELQEMHDRINTIDSPWAMQLEGSYVSYQALRNYCPEIDIHPNIERGNGERLKMVKHGETWNIHRHILRERGITLFGPDAMTLVDPISPDDLRRVMMPAISGWATYILNNPVEIEHRGYQSYVVLTLCRILYTLEYGDIVSKPKAAKWVRDTFANEWNSLIDRTWESRHAPRLTAKIEDINQTLDFIRFVKGRSYEVKILFNS